MAVISPNGKSRQRRLPAHARILWGAVSGGVGSITGTTVYLSIFSYIPVEPSLPGMVAGLLLFYLSLGVPGALAGLCCTIPEVWWRDRNRLILAFACGVLAGLACCGWPWMTMPSLGEISR